MHKCVGLTTRLGPTTGPISANGPISPSGVPQIGRCPDLGLFHSENLMIVPKPCHFNEGTLHFEPTIELRRKIISLMRCTTSEDLSFLVSVSVHHC